MFAGVKLLRPRQSPITSPQFRSIASQKAPSRTRIVDILKLVPNPTKDADSSVIVAGHVRTIRKQKRVAFASLQDGSTISPAQVVLSTEQAAPLSTGAAVVIQGRWVESRGGSEQAYELHADTVTPQGDNDAASDPIQKKFHTAEYLRTLPHLRVRTTHNALLLRLRSEVIASITAHFRRCGFVQTHTPLITSSDCEGAGEVFTVDASSSSDAIEQALTAGAKPTTPDHFFGDPKYLTVSSQLHLEALAQAVGNVWTLSPTFRAEKSDTARHLSEFYMLEAEIAFTSELADVMDVVEDMMRHVARVLSCSELGNEMLAMARRASEESGSSGSASLPLKAETLVARWKSLSRGQAWPRVTFEAACSLLHRAHADGTAQFQKLPDASIGLQTEHEKYLADVIFRGPVFVTDYPAAMKPFYMAPSAPAVDSKVATVSCFDLLLPEVCEVAGGSMREHRYEQLKEQMRRGGLLKSEGPEPAASPLDWYLDLRRYGSAPHGGFGLGFDRFLAFLAGVSNVRDVVTFPRHYKRCLA